MKEKDFLVSVVCPLSVFDSAVINYVNEIIKELSALYEQYEVILVLDDRRTEKFEDITSFVKGTEGLRLIKLMQSSSVDIAITAGLDSSIGDVVVVCLPPFDPPQKIKEFVDVAKAGVIGIGCRAGAHMESFLTRLLKKLFYRFANGPLGLNLPSDTTYFVSLPRQAVTAIQRTGDRFRFLKVITAQIGLPLKLISYNPVEKDGRVYRTFWESSRLSIDVITSQSTLPLKIGSLFSLLLSGISLCYAIYTFNISLFKLDVQPGWGSISLFMSLLGFIGGLVASILCEYLAQLFNESRNRPIYSVADEISSNKVIANANINNVLNTSEITK